jgi:hypothetical protein
LRSVGNGLLAAKLTADGRSLGNGHLEDDVIGEMVEHRLPVSVGGVGETLRKADVVLGFLLV